MIWSGDELAAPNDPHWADEPGHEDDNRWTHRARWDEARAARRANPATVPGRAFSDLATLADTRRRLPYLHAGVPAEVDTPYDPGVLSVVRRHPIGTMLQLYNVTPDWRFYPGNRLGAHRGCPGASGTRLSP